MNVDTDSKAQVVEKLSKETYKLRLEVRETLGSLGSEVTRITKELEQLKKQDQSLIGLRQEVAQLKNQLEEWVYRAIDYVQVLENALSNDNLSQVVRSTMERDLASFCRIFGAVGLDLIRPKPNDAFDARIHNVISEDSEGAQTVKTCLGWGFRRGDLIIKQADVVLGEAISQADSAQSPPLSQELQEQTVPNQEAQTIPLKVPLNRTRWLPLAVAASLLLLVLANIGVMFHATSALKVTPSTHSAASASPTDSMTTELQQVIAPLQTQIQTLAAQLTSRAPETSSEPQRDLASQEVASRTYIIQRGDTLWKIARNLWKDGSRYRDLIEANNLTSTKLQPGMVLIIPDLGSKHD